MRSHNIAVSLGKGSFGAPNWCLMDDTLGFTFAFLTIFRSLQLTDNVTETENIYVLLDLSAIHEYSSVL